MRDRMVLLPPSWFARDAVLCARELLGKIIRKGACEGIIIETEAYGSDEASHAHKKTPRSALMHDTYAHWYVYFTYGMHWCTNVTADAEGAGAVLIRAVVPMRGAAAMMRRRGTRDEANLCSGPAKFSEAFGITGKENGRPLGANFGIFDAPLPSAKHIGVSGRIGISRATELPWRFYLKP